MASRCGSKLLPTEHLRATDSCCLLEHDHLYRSRDVARFSYADDAKHRCRTFVHDQVLDSVRLRRLAGSETQESEGSLLVHLGVVGCSIDSVWATPCLEETIDEIIWNPQRT